MGYNLVFNQVLLGQPGHQINQPGQLGHTQFFISLFFLQSDLISASSQSSSVLTHQTEPDLKTIHKTF